MKFEYIFPSAENGKDESVLTVRNGGVLGILAPSGSGQTLLMKSFAGFERPLAGKVLFDGCPITDRNRSRVSFVPDLDFYDVGERVGSIVRLFSSLFIDFDADRAYEMLFRYGVSTADRISALTESDRQILRLVLGSCRRADVYVLDEPLRNFDTDRRNEAVGEIFSDKRDFSVIVATSRPNGTERVFDDVCFLSEGMPRLISDVATLISTLGKSLSEIFSEVYGCS